jgi:hypothetical protein
LSRILPFFCFPFKFVLLSFLICSSMETSVTVVYLFHSVYHITLKFMILISPNFTNMSFLI